MAASEFTLENVKVFMLSHGGRVKNHELVTHFKAYLNDPDRKGKFDHQHAFPVFDHHSLASYISEQAKMTISSYSTLSSSPAVALTL